MKKYLLSSVLFLLSAGSLLVAQCMLYPVSLEQRVNNSQVIIQGKVLSQKSFWNEAHNYIYTSNKIEVHTVLKGNLTSPFIEIITDGGEVELMKQVVEPALKLIPDEEGVFMINPTNKTSQFGYPVYTTYADEQGFIKFNTRENSAKDHFNYYPDINQNLYKSIGDILKTSLPAYNNAQNAKLNSNLSIAAAISNISPLVSTAGTFSILTITGSGFGTVQNSSNFVEFRNADDGGSTFIQPHPSQYVSWTNTQIQVMIPTRAGTVSGTAGTGQIRLTIANSPTLSVQTLTINHGELNVFNTSNSTIYNTRHVSTNGQGGVTWRMFTGFDANTAAKNSFIRALNSWRCNTYINWPLGPTATTNTIALDGVNVVRFDIGTELPSGVLGRCTSYFSGCSMGPNVYFYVSELDICFDDGTNWQYGPANATGSQFDFESVALHELGHGHQLSHVINTANVMHYSIGPAQNKRVLSSTDIIGGNNVMSRNTSPGVCGQNPMTQISASTCSIVVPTASFNIPASICVNQSLNLTNLSSGSPTNYTWTMTGGSPATSSLQNTSTSYASPGNYTITLVVSNGVGASSPLSKTISVVSAPNISVSSASTCAGNPVVLTASGASTYTWNPGSLSGATQTLNPPNTTNYTIIGSNGTCTNSAMATVSVTPLPTITVNNAVICSGSSTLVSASGASSYTWNPGNLTGSSQNLSPSSTTIYTITGSNNGCTNTKTLSVTVNNCTSLSETEILSKLNIYPNPVNNILNIEFSEKIQANITIINTLGQAVKRFHVNEEDSVKVNFSNLPAGIYLVGINMNNTEESKYYRIVKE